MSKNKEGIAGWDPAVNPELILQKGKVSLCDPKWFKAKKREYGVHHRSHFLWEGQFFCLGNNSVVLLLCKVTSAWNLNRVAATWGGKYDIKLMCFLKHSLRDSQAIILGMDSTQGWMSSVLMCVLAPTCRDNHNSAVKDFLMSSPPELPWKKGNVYTALHTMQQFPKFCSEDKNTQGMHSFS